MPDQAPATPPPSWATWQKIINAQNVPPRERVTEASEPVPVTARVVCGTDGEQLVAGAAIKWTRDLVLVELRDPPMFHDRRVARSG